MGIVKNRITKKFIGSRDNTESEPIKKLIRHFLGKLRLFGFIKLKSINLSINYLCNK